jgi:hypothetical protein
MHVGLWHVLRTATKSKEVGNSFLTMDKVAEEVRAALQTLAEDPKAIADLNQFNPLSGDKLATEIQKHRAKHQAMIDYQFDGLEDDALALELLAAGATEALPTFERFAADQLPGGKYHNVTDPHQRKVMAAMPTTNDDAESAFGLLDMQKKRLGTASTLTLSATATWKLQHTGEFLQQLSDLVGSDFVDLLVEFGRRQLVPDQAAARQRDRDVAERAQQLDEAKSREAQAKLLKKQAHLQQLLADASLARSATSFDSAWKKQARKSETEQRKFLRRQADLMSASESRKPLCRASLGPPRLRAKRAKQSRIP